MVYRNDLDALAVRHRELDAEVQARIRERDDVAHMLAEARDRDAEERRIADLLADGPRRRRRRRLRIAAIALAVVGIVIGTVLVYENHVAYSRHAKIARAMAAMQMFTDKMCACTTLACAQGVSDEMMKWSQEVVKEMGAPVDPKPTEAEMKKMTEIGMRMGQCMQHAMTPPQEGAGR
jgi:hypothetical protein